MGKLGFSLITSPVPIRLFVFCAIEWHSLPRTKGRRRGRAKKNEEERANGGDRRGGEMEELVVKWMGMMPITYTNKAQQT